MQQRDVKIKICGLRSIEDIYYMNELQPDFAGFIFAESKRQVTHEFAAEMRRRLDPGIPAIGVFVNQSMEEILALAENGVIQMVQLHGDESAEYVKELKKKCRLPLIKVLHMKENTPEKEKNQGKKQTEQSRIPQKGMAQDPMKRLIREYEPYCDYFLFDTSTAGSYGGTGKRFPLELLPETSKPYFLAGGLDPYNVEEVLAEVTPFALDVNSGVETDGKKDFEKLRELFRNI